MDIGQEARKGTWKVRVGVGYVGGAVTWFQDMLRNMA